MRSCLIGTVWRIVKPLFASVMVIGSAGLFAGCSEGLLVGCETVVHEEIASPSGFYKAVIFERDCGATTGTNTMIGVIKADEAIGERLRTTVFSAPVSYRFDPSRFSVQWTNGTTLAIRHPESPTPRTSESVLETPDGIFITIEFSSP